jgi:hypothetical protein
VLLACFAPVPDLEYHAQQLLARVGQSRPEASVDLLLGRLDSASENDLSVLRFRAIPDRQLSSTVLNGAGSPREYRELVQRLRDAYPRLSGAARFALANGIWDLVGEPWVAFDVIAEWLVSDNEEERQAALALLGDMPWPLLFDLALPIALLLEELALNAPETATELTRELRGAGQTRSISSERYTTTQTLAIEVAQRLTGYPSAKALYDQIADDAADAIREGVQRDAEAEMLWWH